MSLLNIDFLAGTFTGIFLIPSLVRLWSTGRLDGWIDSRRRKPPVGETVLAVLPGRWREPGSNICALTYNGPNGGGEIPEDMRLLWRPMPKAPWMAGDMDR